jgi:hypothetical protein
MQAVQILLDKQGSILTAVLPLLPLLQALPLHIDAAKTGICENFAKAFSAHIYAAPKVNDVTICTSEESSAIKDTLTRKRKHDGNMMASSSSPIPHHRTFSLKRLRTEPPGHSTPDPVQSREAATSPGAPSTSKLPDAQAPLRRNECASGISPLSHGIPAVTSSVSHRSGGYGRTFAVPTFSTPMNRRPLSDLLPLPPSRQNARPTPRKRGLASLPLSSSELLCGPGFPGRRLRSNAATATAAAANAGMPTVPPGRLYAANAPPGARRLSIGSDVHSSPRSVQRRPTISLTSPAIRDAEERSESTADDRAMPSNSGVSVAPSSGFARDATPKPDQRNPTSDMRDSLDQAVNRRNNPPQNALLDLQKGSRNRVLFGKERLSPVVSSPIAACLSKLFSLPVIVL